MPSSSVSDSTSYQPRAASGFLFAPPNGGTFGAANPPGCLCLFHERLAVRPQNWRHLGVGNAGRFVVLIDDAATQPGSFIGGCDEMAAVGLDTDGGNAAEGLVFRGEREPAAE